MTPIKTFTPVNSTMLDIIEPYLSGGYLIQHSLFTEFDLAIPDTSDLEYYEWFNQLDPTCYYIHTDVEFGFKSIRVGINLTDANYEDLLRLKEIGGMSIFFGAGTGHTKTANPSLVHAINGNILYLVKAV